MSLYYGIEDLVDDGLEGSNLERSIFREIFFRDDIGSTSKKCLVTGAINFECESSENSVITSHSSSKSTCLEEISNVTEDNREASELKDSPKTPASVKENVEGNIEPPCSGKNSDPASEAIALRLVECSSQGLTTSCYLLKQHGETVRGFTLSQPNVSKFTSLSLDGNDGKEIVLSKAIASPVSQESIVSRLFGPCLSVNVQEISELPLDALNKPEEPESFELHVPEVALKALAKKDPRPVLQHHIICLLSAAGWQIGKRQRPSRKYVESVYITPHGKSIWELAKAWRVCGELLFPDRRSSTEEDDARQWNNMSQFLSDLSDTLVILGNETKYDEVANKWRLLDPFVVVAVVNRKIGALKKGEMVKASPKPLAGCNRKGVVKGDLPKKPVSGFALGGDSALVVFEGNDQISWPPNSLPARGTGSTVVQSVSCFCDVSPHQNGSTICRICDVQSSDHNVGTTKVVRLSCDENNDPLVASQVIDAEHYLLTSGDNCPSSPTTGLVPFQGFAIAKSRGCETSKLELADSFSLADVSKKNARRKSKKISEIKPSLLYRNGDTGSASADEAGLLCDDENIKQLELDQDQGDLVVTPRTSGSCKKSKKCSSLKRNRSEKGNSKSVNKKSKKCHIEDDDLLVSAILKSKDVSPSTARYPSRKKAVKPKPQRKRKSQKRTCRLRPNIVDRDKHLNDGKWYSVGMRTVLSWLISSNVVSLNDVVQYRDPTDNAVIKDGCITKDGILCKCCHKVFTVSAFKVHAGFKLNRPCLNLFLASGKSYTLCQLQAWSAEYKTRNGGAPAVKVDNDDRNDDSCGICGDGGELICCDNCPATFHRSCLSTQDVPEGSWYCPNCTCWKCGGLVNDKDTSSDSSGLKCSQCEHKYHDACVEEKIKYQGVVSEAWCCSRSCQEVCSGLQSRVGATIPVADDLMWSLLKGIHDDQKVYSSQRFALKAECSSKLSVAVTIMEECFLSMVDPRTGIDMIPHVIYNWGSEFARLNFQGFYTLVLEKDDVLISVASIRVHGTMVAELPLIATCSKFRRQGMCRILVNAIEEMLTSLKVEKIVVAAIPDLIETWTNGFGFELVDETEKRCLSKINFMVFPGTVLLKKSLYVCGNNSNGQFGDTSEGNGGLSNAEEPQVEFEQVGTEPHSDANTSELEIDDIDVIGCGETRIDSTFSVGIEESMIETEALAKPVEQEMEEAGHGVSNVEQLDGLGFDTSRDQFAVMSGEEEKSFRGSGNGELGLGSVDVELVVDMYADDHNDDDDETQLACDVNVVIK